MHFIPASDAADRWHSEPDESGQEDWMMARDGVLLRLRELDGERVLFRYIPADALDPADPLQGATSTEITHVGDMGTDPWELLAAWPLA